MTAQTKRFTSAISSGCCRRARWRSKPQEHRIVLPSRRLGAVPPVTYTREQLEEAFRSQMDEAEAEEDR